MSDKSIPDADIGLGGIDRFNSETGKSEIIRPSEIGDRPFTIDDYNAQMKAAQDKREQGENIMSEETQQVDTGEPVPENPGGIQIAMRPKLAVYIMKCQFPNEITTELNEHIEKVIIPNNVDHSEGLVGQIRQNKEKSAQLTFPHKGDEVGEMFSGVLEKLAKEYPERKTVNKQLVGNKVETMEKGWYTFFETAQDPENGYLGEDIAFCRLWTNIGGKIYADTQTPLTHFGSHAFHGSLNMMFAKQKPIDDKPKE